MSIKHRIAPVFFPLVGCTHKCIYCDQVAITKVENRCGEGLLDSAVSQLNLWKERYNSEITEVAFYGGTFGNLPSDIRNKLYDIASPCKVRVSTSPDTIKGSFLQEIKAGFINTVELGVQSLSNKVLAMNKRFYTDKDVYTAVSNLEGQCKIGLQFMVGMYGESWYNLFHTARVANTLKADYARIYPLSVFKNTKLEYFYKVGLYQEHSLIEYLSKSVFLYIYLLAANIKVIRVGLPQDIEGSKLLSSSQHPCLGDLVKTVVVSLHSSLTGSRSSLAYNGYRGYIRKNYGLHEPPYIDTIEKICKEILGRYSEGSQRFFKEQIIKVSRDVVDQTNS